jgi:hypothetical protein
MPGWKVSNGKRSAALFAHIRAWWRDRLTRWHHAQYTTAGSHLTPRGMSNGADDSLRNAFVPNTESTSVCRFALKARSVQRAKAANKRMYCAS